MGYLIAGLITLIVTGLRVAYLLCKLAFASVMLIASGFEWLGASISSRHTHEPIDSPRT